jgi:malonyl-CoA/methylmalonyl-CoA synthetase
MLVHHKSRDVAAGLQKHMSAIDTELTYLNLKDGLFRPLLSSSYIFISSDREPDSNSAGAVIFTSGTTGQPKGAVIRRGALGDGLQSVVDLYGIQPLDVVMHCLPVHHATGILITFLPFLIAGGCIEFHGKFDVQRTWERWFEGGLAYFSGVPTIYDRLMRFYEDEARQSSSASAKQFMEAAKNLKGMLCGTSALPGPLRNKWLRLTGKPILERYGATEFGVVYMIPLNGTSRIPDVSSSDKFC